MKYVVVLIDGMADEPIAELNGKTPLEVAKIPTLNALAKVSELGMVHTIPEGMPPGSDVANLSIMGYDPKEYHTGRSPLEAVNIGIDLETNDVVFRCNLVTVSDDDVYEDKVMIDHSASDISSEEARLLLMDLKTELEEEFVKFHAGTSYRNIVTWKNGSMAVKLVPPHDILEQRVKSYMPSGQDAGWIYDMTKKSYDILSQHPVNLKRIEKGLNPANSIWIWGEGKKPRLDAFEEKYGLVGSTISAVDLIKGIGLCAGLDAIDVKGATGTIHTNFKGKANACINALRNGKDFVYLHLEATDECSHQGNLKEKIEAVEIIDREVVKYLKSVLDNMDMDYKLLILPDHPTPVKKRTHTSDPVPFMIFDSTKTARVVDQGYNEHACKQTGLILKSGPDLMTHFINKRQ